MNAKDRKSLLKAAEGLLGGAPMELPQFDIPHPNDVIAPPAQQPAMPSIAKLMQPRRVYPAFSGNRFQTPATQRSFWDKAYDKDFNGTLAKAKSRIPPPAPPPGAGGIAGR